MTVESVEEKFLKITELCAEIGWQIALAPSEEGSVKGIIIGTESYIEEVLDQLEEEYSTYQKGPEDNGELH